MADDQNSLNQMNQPTDSADLQNNSISGLTEDTGQSVQQVDNSDSGFVSDGQNLATDSQNTQMPSNQMVNDTSSSDDTQQGMNALNQEQPEVNAFTVSGGENMEPKVDQAANQSMNVTSDTAQSQENVTYASEVNQMQEQMTPDTTQQPEVNVSNTEGDTNTEVNNATNPTDTADNPAELELNQGASQQQDEPVIEVTETNQGSKSKFNAIVITLLIIGFFLLVIGGAAYYFFVMSPNNKSDSTQNQQPTSQNINNKPAQVDNQNPQDTQQKTDDMANNNDDMPKDLTDDPVIIELDNAGDDLDGIVNSLNNIDLDSVDKELQDESF